MDHPHGSYRIGWSKYHGELDHPPISRIPASLLQPELGGFRLGESHGTKKIHMGI